jgi:hypothetical protein
MLSESTTSRADLRQAWQRLKWWQPLAGILTVVAIRYSQQQLDLGGHSSAVRIWWALLPLPFVVVTVWDIIRRERVKSEVERQIAYSAAMKALLLTAVALVALGQVDTALSLGGSAWRYRDLWFIPLLAYFVISVIETKRYSRE